MEEKEPISRLLAFEPNRSLVAISVGRTARVLNTDTDVELYRIETIGALRVLRFSPCGKYLILGDDKTVRLIQSSDGSVLKSLTLSKKISAGDFARGSDWMVIADRFGDVYCLPTSKDSEEKEMHPCFGHFCSIITSLIVLDAFQSIITCDRDGVARMSAFPKDPDHGSFIIKHFFMGHSRFISSATLCYWNGKWILATAGGDGWVLFFDIETGEERERWNSSTLLLESEDSDVITVATIAGSTSKPVFAGILEEAGIVFVLRLDTEVVLVTAFSMRNVCFPSHAVIDSETLWIIGGPQNEETQESHIAVYRINEDGSLQSAFEEFSKLLSELEHRSKRSESSVEGSTRSLSKALSRKQYSERELAERHRKRAYVQNAEHISQIKNQKTESS